jgi:L-asparagine transporter-like permease
MPDESSVSDKPFIAEWNERAGFVAGIAIINPIIVTAYVLIWHRGAGGLEFWLIGLGLTFIVCMIAGSFMLLVILADRRKRHAAIRRQRMWEGALPYDPAKARPAADSKSG